jgi:hypothetical protein
LANEESTAGTILLVSGEPAPGATLSSIDGTPQLDTSLNVTSGADGVLFLRTIQQWTTDRMTWTDDSQDVLGNSLSNAVEYTLTGLDENQPYYRLFIDGVQQGEWLNIGPGGTYTFNTTLSSPHQMEISIPEPASGLLLALAGAIAFRRRK